MNRLTVIATFVSRFDLVGLYQSVLAKVFNRIPSLQGYGNGNPIWVVTLIEEGVFAFGHFFRQVYEDVHGQKEPLIQSILKEWRELKFERSPYPLELGRPSNYLQMRLSLHSQIGATIRQLAIL